MELRRSSSAFALIFVEASRYAARDALVERLEDWMHQSHGGGGPHISYDPC